MFLPLQMQTCFKSSKTRWVSDVTMWWLPEGRGGRVERRGLSKDPSLSGEEEKWHRSNVSVLEATMQLSANPALSRMLWGTGQGSPCVLAGVSPSFSRPFSIHVPRLGLLSDCRCPGNVCISSSILTPDPQNTFIQQFYWHSYLNPFIHFFVHCWMSVICQALYYALEVPQGAMQNTGPLAFIFWRGI